MRTGPRSRRGGNALIEFTLLGIPLMFITISIVSIGIDMWEFHCLEYTTQLTARYVTMHGRGCSQNGNTCTVTVGNVSTYFKNNALALDGAKTTLQLTDGSGTTTCNTVTACTTTNTQFPGASYNSVGSDVTIWASYTLRNPIAIFWPPLNDPANDFVVAARSRQKVIF
jgi:hypothetical protein